jgi:hypothetical protein
MWERPRRSPNSSGQRVLSLLGPLAAISGVCVAVISAANVVTAASSATAAKVEMLEAASATKLDVTTLVAEVKALKEASAAAAAATKELVKEVMAAELKGALAVVDAKATTSTGTLMVSAATSAVVGGAVASMAVLLLR